MKLFLKKIYYCGTVMCLVLGTLSYCHLKYGDYDPEIPDDIETAGNSLPEGDEGKDTSLEDMSAPKIAITFDDGPHAGTTEKLLDGLKQRHVKASFFLIGSEIEGEESVVKRMKEEGHLIGNHTWTHVQLTTLSDDAASEELRETNKEIASVTGDEPQFMRPPFGTISKKVENKMKMIPILWSVDSLDWTTSNSDEIVNRVVTQVEDGDIILLHDCYDSSVDAALRIIDLLSAEGYEFVTADELITD